jgi:hypothetical protein
MLCLAQDMTAKQVMQQMSLALNAQA